MLDNATYPPLMRSQMLGFLRKRATEIYTAEHIAAFTLDAATNNWNGELGHESTLVRRIALCDAITTQVFIRIGDSQKLVSLYDRYLQKRDELLQTRHLPRPHPDASADMLLLASQIIDAVSVSEQTGCARAVSEAVTGHPAPREISHVLPIIFSIGVLPISIAKLVRGYDDLKL